MAGNSALFVKANKLMREGYSRKQAFAAAYSEMGEPRKVKRKPARTVARNPAPVKRKTRAITQSAAESYVRRPSQITKKKPTKRLTARRAKNLRVPVGVFPNPKARFTWQPYGTPENISYAAHSKNGTRFYVTKRERGNYQLAAHFPNGDIRYYEFGSLAGAKSGAKEVENQSGLFVTTKRNPSRYKTTQNALRGRSPSSSKSGQNNLYKVEIIYPTGNCKLMAQFYTPAAAKEYAKALAVKYDTYSVRVYT